MSRPLQQIHAQLSWLVRHSDIRFEPVPGTAARYELLIPFCYEILRWQVEPVGEDLLSTASLVLMPTYTPLC